MHAPVLSPVQARLIEGWQRGFPLVAEPWATVGPAIGTTPDLALAAAADLVACGKVSRLGAVVRPNTAGASTLAALACAPHEVEAMAAIVSAEPGVNHNYEREHARLPLWFVATGADGDAVTASLDRIGRATGRRVVALPLVEEYRIDLGFPLCGPASTEADRARPKASPSAADRALLASLEDGLPLVARPYRAVADRLGWPEAEVIARLGLLVERGVIKRFGLVVRHRPLGFAHNAMVVFDVAEAGIGALAARFLTHPAVTLLYRRRPSPPDWPYSLYCMIHGRDRAAVGREVAALVAEAGGAIDHEVLFSVRCFKQIGARFSAGAP